MRGGQVTLFVIIGLVLLLTVGVFYFMIANRNTTDNINAQTRTTLDETAQAALTSFVTSCLDTVVEDELHRLGEAGGVTTFDEGVPYGIVGGTRPVLYGITRNRDLEDGVTILPPAYAPPQYPDENVGIANATFDAHVGEPFESFQDGYFGDVQFPAPCDVLGPNKPGSAYSCRFYPNSPPGTRGPSAQEQLKIRIQQRVQSCANLESFKATAGQDVERVGDPTVALEFTPTSTIATLSYPLQLKGYKETVLAPLPRTFSVRYLQISQFAIDLAREESRNATFDIAKDYPKLRSYKDGFLVQRAKDVAVEPKLRDLSPHADLITITDTKSTLLGESYRFSFLVEHRLPMLDPVSDSQFIDLLSGGFPTFRAADPDEGMLTTITVCTAADPSCDGVTKVTVTDLDGDRDWQTYP